MKNNNFLLTITNLHKSFPQSHQIVPVLQGVSFQAAAGKITLIMGPSGSGKTTLLSIIGLLLSADKGEVRLDGIDILDLPEKEKPYLRYHKLGFVFQTANLMPALTALENVLAAPALAGDLTPSKKKQARELLKRMGLSQRLQHLPSQLSRGEQQRVALARALINKPRLLLADEPTGNLDAAAGQVVMKLIREITQENNCAAIVVTHDTRIEPFADQTLYLEGGLFREKLSPQFEPTDAVLRELSDAVIMLDANLNIILVNHQAELILGWSEIEMLGQSLDNFIQFFSLEEKEVINHKLPQLNGNFILALTDRQQRKKIIESKISHFDQETRNKTIVTFRDITDQYYFRKRKSIFIAQASHNLRSPLTIIKGYFELLQENNLPPEEKKELVLKTQISIQNLENLIERLLLVASLEKSHDLHKESVVIKDLLYDLVENYQWEAKAKGLQWQTKIDIPNYLIGKVDPNKLKIALGNILENAVHYTSEGHISFQASLVNQRLVIRISDTGKGIKSEVLGHIFEPFSPGQSGFEMSLEGVGLGLYTSNQIIQLHGGKIEIKSAPGEGTTVTVVLPIN